jgi:molybdate transport system regulatory protein
MCIVQFMPTALLKIDFDGHRLGAGKVRLLELVAKTGSISKAAKEMEMSYRRAWLLIDELNTMFDAPCVETLAGGSGGGGARLTAFGDQVIKLFRQLETKIQAEVKNAAAGLKQ